MLPLALPVVEVDLAKSMFQRAGANGSSRVVESHRLTPIHLERWFVNRAAPSGRKRVPCGGSIYAGLGAWLGSNIGHFDAFKVLRCLTRD
jgi:hypothetical protein